MGQNGDNDATGAARHVARRNLEADAFQASPLALLVLGPGGAVQAANTAASRILGRSLAEIEGATLTELVQESQRLELAALVEKAQRGGAPDRREITFVQPDGAMRIGGLTLARFAAEAGASDDHLPLVAVVRDVTDERSLRDGLIDAENFAKIRLDQGAVQRMHDLVLVHRHGRVVYVNDLTVRKLGHVRDTDLLGRLMLDLVHPDDRAEIAEQPLIVAGAAGAGTPKKARVARRDGGYVQAEFVGLPILFQGEAAVLALGRDLTERSRLEAQLALNERLVATGTLAAGIAHEINNPLCYVLANLETIGEELVAMRPRVREDAVIEDLQTLIAESLDGAHRIRRVVQGLKGISRSDTERSTPIVLEAIVDRALAMASNEIRFRAKVVRNYRPVPVVDGDEARLTQVFINLLINAAQSLPEGRREGSEIRIETFTDERGRARVEVHDTGCGIAPEHVHRIFDAFFTLKPVGVGTGLGLSISHATVTALGGTIEVESTPDKGSVFRVTLPASENAMVEAAAAAEPAPAVRSGRVLVVDDEIGILLAVKRILGRAHDVIAVESGNDARALIASGARFDVILCDLMMPDGTGMELHAALSALAPEQADRMVFVTGGAFSPGASEFLDAVRNERIEKPFAMESLRALVARCMGARTD